MRRAFAVIRPRRIVLVEAEVWPNLTALAQQQKIPIALVNARLSPRSERRFRRFRWFVRPYFQKLDLICVPEKEDIARWQSLGVNRTRIQLRRQHQVRSGRRRAAARDAASRSARLGIDRERPILLGGQHPPGRRRDPGEESSRAAPRISRHFSFSSRRATSSARARSPTNCAPSASSSTRRSEAGDRGATDCLLLDTTGELRDWYSVAHHRLHRQKPDCARRPKPGRSDRGRSSGRLRPAHGKLRRLARDLVAAGGALQPDDVAALTSVTGHSLA